MHPLVYSISSSQFYSSTSCIPSQWSSWFSPLKIAPSGDRLALNAFFSWKSDILCAVPLLIPTVKYKSVCPPLRAGCKRWCRRCWLLEGWMCGCLGNWRCQIWSRSRWLNPTQLSHSRWTNRFSFQSSSAVNHCGKRPPIKSGCWVQL